MVGWTVVTYQRKKFLCLEPCRDILRDVIKQIQQSYPFRIEALVLLPEHLHCIWNLPENDTNYSMRWGWIKKEFTKRASDVVEKMVGTAHPTEFLELAENAGKLEGYKAGKLRRD